MRPATETGAPMEDRRTLIADSAIEVVARDGVRALTHRAVDAEAGLSSGSTSYYCRTRSQLLSLTVDRLVALLRGYVEASGIQELRPSDAAELARALVGMEAGLLTDYRAELTARAALLPELAGEEDTSELVAALLDPSDIVDALSAAGVKHPQDAALDVLSLFEGQLWERLVGRLAGSEPSAQHDGGLFEALLTRQRQRSRGLIGRLR